MSFLLHRAILRVKSFAPKAYQKDIKYNRGRNTENYIIETVSCYSLPQKISLLRHILVTVYPQKTSYLRLLVVTVYPKNTFIKAVSFYSLPKKFTCNICHICDISQLCIKCQSPVFCIRVDFVFCILVESFKSELRTFQQEICTSAIKWQVDKLDHAVSFNLNHQRPCHKK